MIAGQVPIVLSWREMFVLLAGPADVAYDDEGRWGEVIAGPDFKLRSKELFNVYLERNTDIARDRFYKPNVDNLELHYNTDGRCMRIVNNNRQIDERLGIPRRQGADDSNGVHYASWRGFLKIC